MEWQVTTKKHLGCAGSEDIPRIQSIAQRALLCSKKASDLENITASVREMQQMMEEFTGRFGALGRTLEEQTCARVKEALTELENQINIKIPGMFSALLSLHNLSKASIVLTTFSFKIQ